MIVNKLAYELFRFQFLLFLFQILVWWVNTKVALHMGSSGHGGKNNMNSNSHGSQYACSSLCDEIVVLWRLAALNPALSPQEREQLIAKFKGWHLKVLEKVAKSKGKVEPFFFFLYFVNLLMNSVLLVKS